MKFIKIYLQAEIRMILTLLLSLSLVKAYQSFHLEYGDYNNFPIHIESLAMTDDEYIYAVGCAFGPARLLVYKFRRGTYISSRVYPPDYCFTLRGITVDNDDGFLTAEFISLQGNGTNYLGLLVRKFNKNGDGVWEYEQNRNLGLVYPFKMKVLSNGNYAIVGRSSSDPSITVISSTPSMIWRYDASNSYGDGFNSLEETNDESIIAVTGRKCW